MVETEIKAVEYGEEYQILVFLKNGDKLVCDMKPKLITARFRDLADWEVFCSGRIGKSGRIIKWNDNTEISVDEMMLQGRCRYVN